MATGYEPASGWECEPSKIVAASRPASILLKIRTCHLFESARQTLVATVG
jgi:hypothetical protein